MPCLDVLIDVPVQGGEEKYGGKNMDVIQKLLDFMEKRIDKVRQSCTNPRWCASSLTGCYRSFGHRCYFHFNVLARAFVSLCAGLKLQRGFDSSAQPVD